MLPTEAEIEIKYEEFLDRRSSYENDMKDFAKWYATKIIEHCAKIVTLTEDETKLLHLIDEL